MSRDLEPKRYMPHLIWGITKQAVKRGKEECPELCTFAKFEKPPVGMDTRTETELEYLGNTFRDLKGS